VFLRKLGVKSAEVHWSEAALDSVMHNFGMPDSIFINPTAYEKLEKIMREEE
jgi:hypothetical protein